ncbi:MAG: hypothetical protein IJX26_01025 [Clostridia bacterium]|nr:hypothetical protein [Clostridia bacterium]
MGNKINNNKIFAESITISYPRTINLHIDNNLTFTEIPYVIEPSNYNQGLTVKITNHKNQTIETASFKNNVFKAEKVGAYYLKFYVKNKYGKEIYDTIKIKVVDDASDISSITKNLDTVTINEKDNVDLSNIISFNNLSSAMIEYRCNNVLLPSAVYEFESAGNYIIYVNAIFDNLIINTNFNVIVKENTPTDIAVYLNSETSKISENETKTVNLSSGNFVLNINILNSNDEMFQYKIEDLSVLEVVSDDPPFLILKPKKLGMSKITILSIDNSIEINLNIKIVE